MGPNKGGGDKYEGQDVTPAVEGAKGWGERHNYAGLDQGSLIDEEVGGKIGGKGKKPDTSGSGMNDDKPSRGGVER